MEISVSRAEFVALVVGMVGVKALDSVCREYIGPLLNGLFVETYSTHTGGSTVSIWSGTSDNRYHAVLHNVPVVDVPNAAGRVYDSVTAQARRG